MSNFSLNWLWCILFQYLAIISKWYIFINLKFMFNALYILLLKYFVIIKKGEIVAPWIDFEGITNDFGLEKDLLHFRGKIIILSRPDSEVLRARTKDVQSIGGNFNIFGSVFYKKTRFLFLSRPHESTHGLKGWTARWNFG